MCGSFGPSLPLHFLSCVSVCMCQLVLSTDHFRRPKQHWSRSTSSFFIIHIQCRYLFDILIAFCFNTCNVKILKQKVLLDHIYILQDGLNQVKRFCSLFAVKNQISLHLHFLGYVDEIKVKGWIISLFSTTKQNDRYNDNINVKFLQSFKNTLLYLFGYYLTISRVSVTRHGNVRMLKLTKSMIL